MSGLGSPKVKVKYEVVEGPDKLKYIRPKLQDDLVTSIGGHYSSFDTLLDDRAFKKNGLTYDNDFGPRASKLESIRLRVRKATMENNDKDLFALGAIIGGTGAKFTLSSVDRFAIGGFVELRTVFMDASGGSMVHVTESSNSGVNYERKQDKAVPPAALYCQ
jgi:hypothetical protein